MTFVLAPKPEIPKEITVGLHGVLAQLLWLGLDRKARGDEGSARHRTNKKDAPDGTAAPALEQAAGAGFGLWRTA